MKLEWSGSQEEQTRIAGWIRGGLQEPLVIESRTDYITWFQLHHETPRFLCCPLGLALIGFHRLPPNSRSVEEVHEIFYQYRDEYRGTSMQSALEDLAELLGINPALAWQIERVHLYGIPAKNIAEFLNPIPRDLLR